jgi:mannose-1-phosphate guanylyltransferase
MQAMILAAGFGTRLQPYSLHKPKPLFPVLNKPLLVATIERLMGAGFSRIVVNCHHLKEQIIEAVDVFPEVVVQPEEQILGTGGGLRKALEHLDEAPLLVTNGDIYHNLDFGKIFQHHLQTNQQITMVLHDYPRFNNVLTSGGMVTGFAVGSRVRGARAFTGVQVVDPAVLESIAPDRGSCIIEHYRGLLAQGKIISVLEAACQWTDIGTPKDYLKLHEALLSGGLACWPEFEQAAADPVLIHPQASLAAQVDIRDWSCVGRAHIGAGVKLARCVVWDGAEIEAGTVWSDCIIVPEH